MEHTSTITIPSTRVYMDTVDKKSWKSILDTFIGFNTLKEWTYNRMYDDTFLGKGEFNASKGIRGEMDRRYGDGTVPGYYVTSVFSTASGMVKSQKELITLYESENASRIEHIEKSISKDTSRLKHYEAIKASIVKYSKKLKKKGKRYPKVKAFKDTCPERCPERLPDGTYDGKELYKYELYVDSMIKTLKARTAQKGHRAFRKGQKDYSVPKRVTFGGHAFYKTKDTKNLKGTELSAWANERAMKRNGTIHLSGRHDSSHGNFICMYDPLDKKITLKCWDGSEAVFEGVEFPYKGDELVKNILHTDRKTRKSIGYTVELHTDEKGKAYVLFKATIDVDYKYLNDYTGDGVISPDLNYDNISWSELNKDGCRIDGGVIPFDLLSGCTGSNKDKLGRACAILARICRDRKKPLAMEDIDTQEAKTKMLYGSKKGNAHASVFAFRTMTTFLTNKCASYGVGVIKKNPAYTSKSSQMKYMRLMNKTIHEGASLTIGRRGMGFKEKIPKYLRHLVPQYVRNKPAWKQEFSAWGAITKKLKTVPKKYFYNKHPDGMPLSYYKNLGADVEIVQA